MKFNFPVNFGPKFNFPHCPECSSHQWKMNKAKKEVICENCSSRFQFSKQPIIEIIVENLTHQWDKSFWPSIFFHLVTGSLYFLKIINLEILLGLYIVSGLIARVYLGRLNKQRMDENPDYFYKLRNLTEQ